jgi:hypothetical protein
MNLAQMAAMHGWIVNLELGHLWGRFGVGAFNSMQN